jgi:hypothetical protein
MDKGVQVYEGDGTGPPREPVPVPVLDTWDDLHKIADGPMPKSDRFAWVADKLIDQVDNGLTVGEVTPVQKRGERAVRWKGRFRKVRSVVFNDKLECMKHVWELALRGGVSP